MTQKFPIQELLPQQPPFIMIDRLLHCDMVVTETELQVREDNLFFKDGLFREPGIMENIAQTCAGRMGYINKINQQEIKVGFIGALKNLVIEELPTVNDVLNTRIEVVKEIMDLTLVKATVKCGERKIAECEMKIAIGDK